MKSVLVVCAIVAYGGSAATDRCRIPVMKASFNVLTNTIFSFRHDSGRLPTEEEGLSVLIRRPTDWPDHVHWESYLETTEVPVDAWGNEFVYVLDANLPDGFGIYSCGKDGVTSSRGNDPDDLNTWNSYQSWLVYRQNARDRGWTRAVFVYLLLLSGIVLVLWETSRIENHLKQRRAARS